MEEQGRVCVVEEQGKGYVWSWEELRKGGECDQNACVTSQRTSKVRQKQSKDFNVRLETMKV